MKSSEILANIEATLDRLIRLSRMQDQLSTDDEADAFRKAQDTLLDHLMRLDHLLDEDEKHLILQSDPTLYGNLDEKVRRFSSINLEGLRPKRDPWIQKARVHRNRNKLA